MATLQVSIGRLSVFICCLLFAAVTLAEVAVPALSQRVTDLTATLNSQQRSALEQRLAEFERQKGSQIAVLMIPTTQPETIEQYSIRVVEAWQLGRQSIDDGVLLLVAKNDRSTRIEVGYGLEGAISDATAKRIIEEEITPYFRQGDFAGGINTGVNSLIVLINGETLPEATQPVVPQSNDVLLLFLLLIVGGWLFRLLFGPLLGGLANGVTAAISAYILGFDTFIVVFCLIIGFVIVQYNRRDRNRRNDDDSDCFDGIFDFFAGGEFSSGGGFSGDGGGSSGDW